MNEKSKEIKLRGGEILAPVQALNNYKKQLNQSIIEIQTDISILNNQKNELTDIQN